MEIDSKNIHTQKRMELKVKELESKIELEQTAKSRLEVRQALHYSLNCSRRNRGCLFLVSCHKIILVCSSGTP